MFYFLKNDKKFEQAISVVLPHEGLLTDDKNDPGGITNYGISLRFLRAAGIDGNMNRSNHVTEQDIKALNPEKAKAIYYKYFYIKNHIDEINSEVIGTAVLDMSVLMDGPVAIKLLQKAINNSFGYRLKEDGILGPLTLSIVNKKDEHQLILAFKDQCIRYLNDLVVKNEKLHVFIDGWINRVNSL